MVGFDNELSIEQVRTPLLDRMYHGEALLLCCMPVELGPPKLTREIRDGPFALHEYGTDLEVARIGLDHELRGLNLEAVDDGIELREREDRVAVEGLFELLPVRNELRSELD